LGFTLGTSDPFTPVTSRLLGSPCDRCTGERLRLADLNSFGGRGHFLENLLLAYVWTELEAVLPI